MCTDNHFNYLENGSSRLIKTHEVSVFALCRSTYFVREANGNTHGGDYMRQLGLIKPCRPNIMHSGTSVSSAQPSYRRFIVSMEKLRLGILHIVRTELPCIIIAFVGLVLHFECCTGAKMILQLSRHLFVLVRGGDKKRCGLFVYEMYFTCVAMLLSGCQAIFISLGQVYK